MIRSFLFSLGAVFLFVSCPSESRAADAPTTLPSAPGAVLVSPDAFDALDQVNAQRASRGLPPYLRDDALTAAARAAAGFRAGNLLFGHSSNDFAFLPPGASCDAAGCAAYPDAYGFMACEVYGNYTHAGAFSVRGRDGKLYHHLFVRRVAGAFAQVIDRTVHRVVNAAPFVQSCGTPRVVFRERTRVFFRCR